MTGLIASEEEALQLAAGQQPNLMLMDIMLRGDMDRMEAAEHLRRRFEVAVLFLTA